MSVRNLAIVFVIVMAFVGGMVWQRQTMHSPQQQAQEGGEMPPGGEMPSMPQDGGQGMPPQGMPQQGTPNIQAADPGLDWNVPKRWSKAPDRAMRVATYVIPKQGGDPEDGECAVFHFGPGQGGPVDANIQRWVDQFANVKSPNRSTKTIAGMSAHYVSLEGDFLAPAGPMMESQGTKTGYALRGAIIEGPMGGVFFKFTGPKKTVAAAAREFDDMIASVHPR